MVHRNCSLTLAYLSDLCLISASVPCRRQAGINKTKLTTEMSIDILIAANFVKSCKLKVYKVTDNCY